MLRITASSAAKPKRPIKSGRRNHAPHIPASGDARGPPGLDAQLRLAQAPVSEGLKGRSRVERAASATLAFTPATGSRFCGPEPEGCKPVQGGHQAQVVRQGGRPLIWKPGCPDGGPPHWIQAEGCQVRMRNARGLRPRLGGLCAIWPRMGNLGRGWKSSFCDGRSNGRRAEEKTLARTGSRPLGFDLSRPPVIPWWSVTDADDLERNCE